jgi:hypothetical protein
LKNLFKAMPLITIHYKRPTFHQLIPFFQAVFFALLLWLSSLISIEFFRSFVNLFSIIVAAGIFIVAWNARRITESWFLIILGIGYLFVGVLTVIPAAAFLQAVPAAKSSLNLASQFRLTGRFIEVITLTASFALIGKKFQTVKTREFFAYLIFLAYLSVSLILFFLIYFDKAFPVVYVAGHGPTNFKIASEFIISGFFILALYLLLRKRDRLDKKTVFFFSLSIICGIAAELFLASYELPQNWENIFGHIAMFVSYYFLYKAVIEVSLEKPFALIFQNLKRSEERFEHALKSSPLVVFNQNADLRYTWFYNPSLSDLGASIAGKSDHDLFSEENAQKLIEIKQKVLETGGKIREEITLANEGGRRYYDLTIEPIFSESGKISGLTGSSIDITPRKTAENALKESELKYKIVANNTSDWEFWLSPDKKFIYNSPSCEEITGYPASDFIKNPALMTGIIHPDDQSKYANHCNESVCEKTRSFVEYRIIKKNGEIRWIAHVCQPVFGSNGEFLGSRGNNRDITKKKLMEKNLLENEARYRAIVEDQTEFVIRWLPNRKLTFVNQSICRYFQKNQNEFIGQDFLTFVLDVDKKKITSHIANFTKKFPVQIIECRIQTRNKEIRWLRWTSRAIFNENGEIIEFQSAGRDITEKKKTDEMLKSAYATLEEKVAYRTSELAKANNLLKLEISEREKIENSLKKSEARYRELWDNAPTAYHILDQNGVILQTNKTEAKMLGYSVEEMIGRPIFNFILPEQQENARQRFLKKITGLEIPKNEDRVYVKKNGEKIFVTLDEQLEYGANGKIIGIRTSLTDTTELKKAKNELEKINAELDQRIKDRTRELSETNQALQQEIKEHDKAEKTIKFHANILEHIAESAIATDNEKRIIYWNKGAEELYLIRAEDAVGKKISEIYVYHWQGPEEKEKYHQSLLKIGSWHGESRHTTIKNNKELFVDSLVSIIRDKNGEKIGKLVLTRDITGKKKAENQLKESYQKINQLLMAIETAKEAIHIDDPDGKIIYTNQAMDELFGYPKNELLGKIASTLNAGTQKDALAQMEIISRGLDETGVWEGEVKNRRKNGEELTTYSRVSVQRDENGVIVNFISTQHDITNEKKNREERERLFIENETKRKHIESLLTNIAQEKELLKIIAENTDTHLAYLDKEFNFIWTNPAYTAASGYSAEGLIGKNYFTLFPNDENFAIFEQTRNTGAPAIYKSKPFIFSGKLEEETSYWDWSLIPVKNKQDKVDSLVLSLTDVTQKQERIEELKRSREELKAHSDKLEQLTRDLKKFQLATDNSSNIIIISDPKDKILYANAAVEKITGYKPEELIGKTSSYWSNYTNKNSDPNFYQKIRQQTKIEKKPFYGEFTTLKKNGEKYIAEVYIAPVLDEKGEIIFFVRLERDITESKEIDRAKTEFVSIASHQLRTPLAMIGLAVEMLLGGMSGTCDPEANKQLEDIYRDVRGMSKLIDSLLNVSRIEMRTMVIAPEPTNLKDILTDVLKELLPQMKNKSLQIKAFYDQALPIINIDQNLIRIVLQNLISNAIKYTPENGTVSCEMKSNGQDALIKISDTGCGIPENQQNKIFDKMFRASNVIEQGKDGIGLGLYIVKSIVSQYGGKIWLNSKTGRGTTFYITVPLSGMKRTITRESGSENNLTIS